MPRKPTTALLPSTTVKSRPEVDAKRPRVSTTRRRGWYVAVILRSRRSENTPARRDVRGKHRCVNDYVQKKKIRLIPQIDSGWSCLCVRGRQEIRFTNMTPGFWPLARRERGAYPQVSVTSEQRSQRPKDQVRLERLFLDGPYTHADRDNHVPRFHRKKIATAPAEGCNHDAGEKIFYNFSMMTPAAFDPSTAHTQTAPAALPLALFELRNPPHPASELNFQQPPEQTNAITYAIRFDGRIIPFKFLRAPGSGQPRPALLLLHGLGLHIASFHGVARYLLPEHDLILVDYTGFSCPTGRSLDGPGIKELTHSAIAVPKALGIQQLAIGGSSLGGGMCLMASLDFPQMVQRIILLNPAIFPQTLPFFFRLVRIPLLGELVMCLRSPKQMTRGIREVGYADPRRLDLELMEVYRLNMVPRVNRLRVMDIIRRLPTLDTDMSDYLTRARRLVQPVLVIWGEKESLLCADSGRRLCDALPNVDFRPFADLSHLPHEEDPSRIGPIMAEFLRGDIRR